MKNPRKPWSCSSLSSCEPPQTYCIECSHATFRGQATINGKRYRWEWRPYYGVEFYRRGEFDWTPNVKHPVWAEFEKWLARLLAGGKISELHHS
jgi:hypothetical protein